MQHRDWDDRSEFDGYGYNDEGEPCFANPGSALRCATEKDPRNRPCPTCGEPDRLTKQDEDLGYQCDTCADQAERGY